MTKLTALLAFVLVSVPALAQDQESNDVDAIDENDEVKLEVAKNNYALGEPVTVTITNKPGGAARLKFEADARVMMGDFEDWSFFYDHRIDGILEDGRSMTWTWNQETDTNGARVRDGGIYALHVTPETPEGQSLDEVGVTFRISGSTEVGASMIDVSLDRAFYVPGETVKIEVRRDQGPEPLVLMRLYVLRGGRIVWSGNEAKMFEGAPRISWSWDQTVYGGAAAWPGTYIVAIDVQFDDGSLSRTRLAECVIHRSSSEPVVVRLTKTRFVRGQEPVSFFLLNRSRSIVTVADPRPYVIYRSSGAPFYRPRLEDWMGIPAEGGRFQWSWDQRNGSGELARSGRYRADLSYRIRGDSGPAQVVPLRFRIVSR